MHMCFDQGQKVVKYCDLLSPRGQIPLLSKQGADAQNQVTEQC